MLSTRRSARSVSVAVVAALCVALGGVLAAPASGATTERARLQAFADAVVAAGAPGAIVLVREDGVTTSAASGVADLATGRALRPTAAFRSGSTTKTTVATRVLQLVAQGRLGLDVPVRTYVPGLLPDGDRITVRMLLQHTSGLFNYTADPAFGAAVEAGAQLSPRDLVGFATTHPLDFEPGSSWSYSNTGYVVLGLVVNSVSEVGVSKQLANRVFGPAGMTHTTFPLVRDTVPPSGAHGYVALPPSGDLVDVTTAYQPQWIWTAGALVTTADDLAGFYGHLMAGDLTTAPMLRQMTTTTVAGQDVGYGLGLIHYQLPCGRAWGHDGLWAGTMTIAMSSADGRRQTVVMMNLDGVNGAPPPAAVPALVDALVGGYCGPAAATARSGALDPADLLGPDLTQPVLPLMHG